jgi:uncharacterized ferritin-like protein (DUF455 family)
MIVFLIFLAIIVDEDVAHTKVGNNWWMLFRVFPKNKV